MNNNISFLVSPWYIAGNAYSSYYNIVHRDHISPNIIVKCSQDIPVCVCRSVDIVMSICLRFLSQGDGGWIPQGLPLMPSLPPFRLKLNSKRNQLVRELEEATRQVAALHSQLKR